MEIAVGIATHGRPAILAETLAFLEQQQPRIDPASISRFLGQIMIQSPTAIPIGNETDMAREIIFCHGKSAPGTIGGHAA